MNWTMYQFDAAVEHLVIELGWDTASPCSSLCLSKSLYERIR